MKSIAPPLRARRWPARRRSTAPDRSPSADARFGFGAQRAQRLAQARPGLAEQGPGAGVLRVQRDPGLQVVGALLQGRIGERGTGRGRAGRSDLGRPGGRQRDLRRISVTGRGRRRQTAAAPPPRAAGVAAREQGLHRQQRHHRARRVGGGAVAGRAPASARWPAPHRRAPSRAAGSRPARCCRPRPGARAVLRSGARRVQRLPAAQRIDARVHQHARTRLRDARARSATRTGAARGARCPGARAPRRCARWSAGGCAGRGSRRCRSGARTGRASRTSPPCRRAQSRRSVRTCEADAVGLALHVAREVELALDRRRLRRRRSPRWRASTLLRAAGGEHAEDHRGHADQRLLLAVGDAARDVALRDVRQLVRQHRGQFVARCRSARSARGARRRSRPAARRR